MTWNILDEISIRQLHHVLSARFFCLTADVLTSRPYLISNFVETLNATNCKCIFLSPHLNSHNSWIGYLTNQSSVSKSLTLFSRQTFFIVFKMGLVRKSLLVGVLNLFSCSLRLLLWFLFLVWFFESDIGFDVIFSHLDFKFINFFLFKSLK